MYISPVFSCRVTFYHDNKDDNRIHIPENELHYENNSLQQPAVFMGNTSQKCKIQILSMI